jgi:hypothetical protein
VLAILAESMIRAADLDQRLPASAPSSAAGLSDSTAS